MPSSATLTARRQETFLRNGPHGQTVESNLRSTCPLQMKPLTVTAELGMDCIPRKHAKFLPAFSKYNTRHPIKLLATEFGLIFNATLSDKPVNSISNTRYCLVLLLLRCCSNRSLRRTHSQIKM